MDSGLGIGRQLGEKQCECLQRHHEYERKDANVGSEKEEDDAWKETVVTK